MVNIAFIYIENGHYSCCTDYCNLGNLGHGIEMTVSKDAISGSTCYINQDDNERQLECLHAAIGEYQTKWLTDQPACCELLSSPQTPELHAVCNTRLRQCIHLCVHVRASVLAL